MSSVMNVFFEMEWGNLLFFKWIAIEEQSVKRGIILKIIKKQNVECIVWDFD